VRIMRRSYDWIFIDTQSAEVYDEYFVDFLLDEADQILVLTDTNETTVSNNKSWIAHLQKPKSVGGANVDPAKIAVIINRADVPWGYSSEEVERILGFPRIVGVIPERAGRFDPVALRDRHLRAALDHIAFGVTGDTSLEPSTGLGRRRQIRLIRQMFDRGN